MFLGHRVDLKAKAGGENSMLGEAGDHWKTLKVPSRKTRVIGRKLHCLNPNPQWWNRTPAATASRSQCPRSGSFEFRDRLPPPGGAMENDSIQGDEWDAYVTLDTFSTNGTRDGLTGASPTVTESP